MSLALGTLAAARHGHSPASSHRARQVQACIERQRPTVPFWQRSVRSRPGQTSSGRVIVEARLRAGRQTLQRRHRDERLLGNRDVLDYLLSIGVERLQCLMVYGKATESVMLKYGPEEEITLEDAQASVEFLKEMGLSVSALPKVIQDYPSILSYDVDEHLRPIYEYLAELGVEPEKISRAIVKRPSLLGLSADGSLKKMVSYLLDNGTPKEKVIEYVLTTL